MGRGNLLSVGFLVGVPSKEPQKGRMFPDCAAIDKSARTGEGRATG